MSIPGLYITVAREHVWYPSFDMPFNPEIYRWLIDREFVVGWGKDNGIWIGRDTSSRLELYRDDPADDRIIAFPVTRARDARLFKLTFG